MSVVKQVASLKSALPYYHRAHMASVVGGLTKAKV